MKMPISPKISRIGQNEFQIRFLRHFLHSIRKTCIFGFTCPLISLPVRRSLCFVQRFVFRNLGFYVCHLQSLYLAHRRISRRFLAIHCLQRQTDQSDKSCFRRAVVSWQAVVSVRSGPFIFLEKVLTSQIFKEHCLP